MHLCGGAARFSGVFLRGIKRGCRSAEAECDTI